MNSVRPVFTFESSDFDNYDFEVKYVKKDDLNRLNDIPALKAVIPQIYKGKSELCSVRVPAFSENEWVQYWTSTVKRGPRLHLRNCYGASMLYAVAKEDVREFCDAQKNKAAKTDVEEEDEFSDTEENEQLFLISEKINALSEVEKKVRNKLVHYADIDAKAERVKGEKEEQIRLLKLELKKRTRAAREWQMEVNITMSKHEEVQREIEALENRPQKVESLEKVKRQLKMQIDKIKQELTKYADYQKEKQQSISNLEAELGKVKEKIERADKKLSLYNFTLGKLGKEKEWLEGKKSKIASQAPDCVPGSSKDN